MNFEFRRLKFGSPLVELLYSFAIDGKLIPSFAAISRVHRRDAHLEGYQRPEVLAHIAEIRDYLESESPMIPNAVVIAFDKRVHFEPAGDTGGFVLRSSGHVGDSD